MQLSFSLFKLEGHKIITGDFNTVLDVNIDRASCAQQNNNVHSADFINTFLENYCFQDIWRARNPDLKQFTWSRSRPSFIGSRLDYFLIETSLASWVEDVKITSGIKSDHRPVKLSISPYGIARGKGVWKLNSLLLSNIDYVEHINKTLESAKEWSKNLEPQERWDSIKMIVIAESQEFGKCLAAENRNTICHLEQAVETMQNKIDPSEIDVQLLDKTK